MRYTLDNNGYIKTVAWGCMTGNCAEYTGAVPSGYSSLPDWADNACINAYYLDENGNLVLDAQKMNYLQAMYEQQAIDYAPVLHRDLYATNEIIEAQYKKNTASGTIITLTNARNIAPMVKITGLTGNSLSVFAQTKNMLRNDAISLTANGLTFTRDGDGIKISGKATADVEYTIAGGGAEPLFALLQGHSYYLSASGLRCELLYFDGETTEQVYNGFSGVITLSETKLVSEVRLKFLNGQTADNTIYPTLAYGTKKIDYEESQTKVYNMELPEYEAGASIIIGEGLAVLYSGGDTHVVGRSNMGLLNGYNMIYTSQGNPMEITYTTNEFLIDDMAFLQGTATTSGKFMILEDGSIQATGGTFEGEVTCTKLTVEAGGTISGIPTGGISETKAVEIANGCVSAAKIRADQVLAGSFRMTGGSIDITADSSDENRITLRYDDSGVAIYPGAVVTWLYDSIGDYSASWLTLEYDDGEESSRGGLQSMGDGLHVWSDAYVILDKTTIAQSMIRPSSSNKYALGSADYLWSNVYCKNSEINTSDRNEKENIQLVSDKYIAMFDALTPVSYKWIDGDRTHIGFISQEVEEKMAAAGLTDMDFGGFCKDLITDEEGNEIERYGLRYGEFIGIMAAKIKQLEARIEELENGGTV